MDKGGFATWALVDLTGGTPEMVDLEELRMDHGPGNLFEVMYTTYQKGSMISCDLEVTSDFFVGYYFINLLRDWRLPSTLQP